MINVGNAVINTPVLIILKDLQTQLTNGKLSLLQEKSDYIRVPCPVHSGGHESHPSCSVYTGESSMSQGTWHCFTCGAKGSIVSFVQACFNSSEGFARDWLIKNYGEELSESFLDLKPIILSREESRKLQDVSLERFEDFHPYMKKRHLTDAVIKDFDIKYDPETKSIVMPVKDKNGDIVFLTRRSIEGKRFIIDKGADKSNLYCIDKITDNTVYLVESQFNCLTLWGWGKQALALFGCACTDDQIKVLNNLSVKHYIIAFDNDSAGREGTQRLCAKLSISKFVDVVELTDNRDVNELTKEEFEKLNCVDRSEFLQKRRNKDAN